MHPCRINHACTCTYPRTHACIHTYRQADRQAYIHMGPYVPTCEQNVFRCITVCVYRLFCVCRICLSTWTCAYIPPYVPMPCILYTEPYRARCNTCEAKSPSSITDDASGSVCLFVIACTAVGADVILPTLVVPRIHQSNYVIQSSAPGTHQLSPSSLVAGAWLAFVWCVARLPCINVPVLVNVNGSFFFMAASTGSYFCCIRLISPVTVMATYRTRVLFRYVLMSDGCVQHSRSCACG